MNLDVRIVRESLDLAALEQPQISERAESSAPPSTVRAIFPMPRAGCSATASSVGICAGGGRASTAHSCKQVHRAACGLGDAPAPELAISRIDEFRRR